jgi:uncharacterized protein involved in exopolysaccharide biosynthesis
MPLTTQIPNSDDQSDRSAPGRFAADANVTDFPVQAIALAIRRAWRAIALVVVGMGVAGFALAGLRAPVYEAHATLLVSDSKMRDGGSAVNPSSFIALLANRALARQVLDEFHLDVEPYQLTATELLSLIRVEDVRNATLVRIRLQLPDAELAAKVTNRFAELAVELNRNLNQKDTAGARDLIKAQLDEAQARLEASRAALLALRRESQVELRKAAVDALVEQREEIDAVLVSLATEKARLAQLERDLAGQVATLDSPRAPTADADLVAAINEREREAAINEQRREAARSERQREADSKERPRDADGTTRLDSTVPMLPAGDGRTNPVRLLLEYQVATARARVAALEQERRELQDVVRLTPEHSADLERFYRSQEELKRRELDVRVAESAYSELSTRYEQARLLVAGRSAELQVVDPALVPTLPVSWGRTQIALVSAIMGLVMITGFLAARALLATWRTS